MKSIVPDSWRFSAPGEKIHKLADMLAVKSSDEIYDRLISNWKLSDEAVCFAPFDTSLYERSRDMGLKEMEHRMMYLDAISYLPDDILVKVDRAAMAVSLETRVPFLDHRVVEFAWRLPLHMKIRHGTGKWLVRQVLDRYVPRNLIERPKSGFAVPLDTWLRGGLKDWAGSLLNAPVISQSDYFRADVINRYWIEHQSEKRNRAHKLWAVLMLQAWLITHSKLKSEA
jgi:asparagine synthase (glutamine-hydrolysing)